MTATDLSVITLGEIALKKKKLPFQAYKLYGCRSCEWDKTTLCPRVNNLPSAKICTERINYLKSFIRDKDTPSFTEFQLDLSKGLSNIEMMKEYKNLLRARRDYEALLKDSSTDPLEVKRAERNVDARRVAWFGMMRDMMKLEDAQVTRETPKEVTVFHNNIPLNQMHKIMSGDIKDTEFEIMDEGSEIGDSKEE